MHTKDKKEYFNSLNIIYSLFIIFPIILLAHYTARSIIYIEEIVADYFLELNIEALNYYTGAFGLKIIDGPDPSQENIFNIADREARHRGVSSQIIRAIIMQESNKKQLAISAKGALGYMQVMPANAKFCGLSDPGQLLLKTENIRCGVAIFEDNLARYKGDVFHALQAYNGGPRCVNKCQDSIIYAKQVINRSALMIE